MHKSSDIRIKNKRASFDYEFIDKYVAGIELFGTEIKSIRLGKASLCIFRCGRRNRKSRHACEGICSRDRSR